MQQDIARLDDTLDNGFEDFKTQKRIDLGLDVDPNENTDLDSPQIPPIDGPVLPTDLESQAEKIKESLLGPLDKFDLELAELLKLKELKLLDENQFDSALGKLEEKYKEALTGISKEMESKSKSLLESLQTPTDKFQIEVE